MTAEWWDDPAYERYFGPGRNIPVAIGDDITAGTRYTAVTDTESYPLEVRAVIETTAAGPRCVDLRLIARADGEPVTSDALRAIPVGRLAWQAERATLLGSSDGERDVRAAYRRAVTRRRTSSRRRLSADMLAKVADVYRRALADGLPPTAAVQQYFNLPTRGQAAKWVQRAREPDPESGRPYLGPAPGRRKPGEIR